MLYEILGNALQLTGLFFAFLSVGFVLLMIEATKGSIFSKSCKYLAIGITIMAINFFVTYAAAVTGQFNSEVWAILGAITTLGFGFIILGTNSLIRALRGLA